jgi:hypothetical protein
MNVYTTALRRYRRSPTLAAIRTVAEDIYQGFFGITHNSVALLGTVSAVALVVLAMNANLRNSAEDQLLGWLLERQEAVQTAQADAADTDESALTLDPEPSAIDRVTAAQPHELPKQQAKVAYWLSRKYRVAPEPLSVLVAEAFEIGERSRLDPTLILAVMAIESRFNPFAQSPVGAQGLMQVLTRVHTDKYEDFGGKLAAFDPVSNLRVGVKVLQDCIKRAGSVEGGLRLYVGAVTTDGSWYVNKVMAEHRRIQSIALGQPVVPYDAKAAAIPVVAPAKPDSAPAKAADAAIEAVAPAQTPASTSTGTPLVQS